MGHRAYRVHEIGVNSCRPRAANRKQCSNGLGRSQYPRTDTSEFVWFTNDQLAVRFIEEIDFDYVATDARAASTGFHGAAALVRMSRKSNKTGPQ